MSEYPVQGKRVSHGTSSRRLLGLRFFWVSGQGKLLRVVFRFFISLFFINVMHAFAFSSVLGSELGWVCVLAFASVGQSGAVCLWLNIRAFTICTVVWPMSVDARGLETKPPSLRSRTTAGQ